MNPRLKRLRKLSEGHSQEDGWIVEGRSLFEDAVESGASFEEVFITPAALSKLSSLQALEQKGTKVMEIPAKVMARLSTLKTPPGIIGIAHRPALPVQTRIVDFACLLLSVRDPGNLGTLIRSAEATGCEHIACSPDCADPHQPKVVRGSMGSIFRIPSFKLKNADDYIQEKQDQGATVYGLYPRGGTDLGKIRPRYPALIVLGGEASGIPDNMEIRERITIPMKGKVESLNTAVAGTLCFYHFQRFAE